MDKRTFVAVNISPGQQLSGLIKDVREHLQGEYINWVDERIFHLTLKFLGNTPVRDLDKIGMSLQKIAENQPVFEISVGGFGFFQQYNNPSVIFCKIGGNQQLVSLAKSIDLAMGSFGFAPETRVFHPHLTLGRVKKAVDNHKYNELSVKHKSSDIQLVTVNELYFYESILQPRGPIYKPLKIFNLTTHKL